MWSRPQPRSPEVSHWAVEQLQAEVRQWRQLYLSEGQINYILSNFIISCLFWNPIAGWTGPPSHQLMITVIKEQDSSRFNWDGVGFPGLSGCYSLNYAAVGQDCRGNSHSAICFFVVFFLSTPSLRFHPLTLFSLPYAGAYGLYDLVWFSIITICTTLVYIISIKFRL